MISLQEEFDKHKINKGRDTLFNILRKHYMLVEPKKASGRTTQSYHRFNKYKNKIKDLTIVRQNQAWG